MRVDIKVAFELSGEGIDRTDEVEDRLWQLTEQQREELGKLLAHMGGDFEVVYVIEGNVPETGELRNYEWRIKPQ